jgi:hypothetical protein
VNSFDLKLSLPQHAESDDDQPESPTLGWVSFTNICVWKDQD